MNWGGGGDGSVRAEEHDSDGEVGSLCTVRYSGGNIGLKTYSQGRAHPLAEGRSFGGGEQLAVEYTTSEASHDAMTQSDLTKSQTPSPSLCGPEKVDTRKYGQTW